MIEIELTGDNWRPTSDDQGVIVWPEKRTDSEGEPDFSGWEPVGYTEEPGWS